MSKIVLRQPVNQKVPKKNEAQLQRWKKLSHVAISPRTAKWPKVDSDDVVQKSIAVTAKGEEVEEADDVEVGTPIDVEGTTSAADSGNDDQTTADTEPQADDDQAIVESDQAPSEEDETDENPYTMLIREIREAFDELP